MFRPLVQPTPPFPTSLTLKIETHRKCKHKIFEELIWGIKINKTYNNIEYCTNSRFLTIYFSVTRELTDQNKKVPDPTSEVPEPGVFWLKLSPVSVMCQFVPLRPHVIQPYHSCLCSHFGFCFGSSKRDI